MLLLFRQQFSSCRPYPVKQYLRLYIELDAAALHIDRPFDRIRNQRYRIGYIVYQIGFLQRVTSGLIEKQVRFETYEILFVLTYKATDFLLSMLA